MCTRWESRRKQNSRELMIGLREGANKQIQHGQKNGNIMASPACPAKVHSNYQAIVKMD